MSLPQSFEGKFEILHKISEGGMGAVYKVRHVLLDEIRVIKVIRPQHEGDENLELRFHREARTATRLRHRNIAVMHDFSIGDEGTAYIVMEYIDGRTLHQILAQCGPPSLDLTLEIARQGLDALAYLHHQGYVHRDISPDNLMLTRDFDGSPLVKLIDLGVAKRVGGGHELTSTGMFLGKVSYSSPEQFSGGDLDPRSDVYSFGVMLYELLTGRNPIEGEDFSSKIAGHLYRPPVPFEVSDPGGRVPQGLRRVVMKTLEKKPEDRVLSAEKLAGELAPFADPGRRDHAGMVEETRRTVLLEVPAAPLPSGFVDEAVRQIDDLLVSGRFEAAERQLTRAAAELGGEAEYLRGLREKIERARADRFAAAPPARGGEERAVEATLPAAGVGRRRRMRPGPGRLVLAAAGLVLAAGAGYVATTWRPAATGTVAVPIAEQAYLAARQQVAAGDLQGVTLLLRQASDADPVEKAARSWVTPGAEGPYLPHYLLGQVYAGQQNCVLAMEAWEESERQGVVQTTPEHALLLESKMQCEALYRAAVERLGKRLVEGAEYAGALEGLAGDAALPPELSEEIRGTLERFREARASFERARGAGFGAVVGLEAEIADAVDEVHGLVDRVLRSGKPD